MVMEPGGEIPIDKETWKNKGSGLYDPGKYDEANQAFDEAIRLKPDSWTPWLVKSLALDALGSTTEADAALSKAKELGYDG